MNQRQIIAKYKGRAELLRNKLLQLGLPIAVGRGSNFKNASALANHYRSLTHGVGELEQAFGDEYASDFLSAINETENLRLSDLHQRTFDLESMSAPYMRMFGERFTELMNDSNAYNSIMLQLDVTDENGNEVTIYRNITRDNIKFFKKLFKNKGVYESFENIAKDSDTDWISKRVVVNRITVLDMNQLPSKKRKYVKRDGAHWNWLLDAEGRSPEASSASTELECFDLSRYQIYRKNQEIDDENCLVYALRNSGKIDASVINDIKRDVGEKKYIELDTIKFICEKYKLSIWIYVIEKHIRAPQKIEFSNAEPIKLALMNNHYFLRESLPFNVQYFKYRDDERLKQFPLQQQLLVQSFYNNEWLFYEQPPVKDIIEILRKLFTFNGFSVIEDYEELLKIRRKKTSELPIEFKLNENNFKRYELSNAYLSKFYSKIPNLYMINGNFANCVMKCLRGGRVMIEKTQKLIEAVIALDVNSLYPFAMCLCGIQTGKPKLFGRIGISIRELVTLPINSAFMLINITSFKKRKYSAINDLKLGECWVDLITLRDLIAYHDTEGYLVNGFYYDAPIDYNIRKLVSKLYKLKQTDSKYKLMLNKIYGLSLKRTTFTKKKLVKTENLMSFVQTHYHQVICAKRLDSEYAEVEMYKKFSNHYNLAHFGVSILSTARHIMNEYFFKCEESGIDILYSCTDSLFIRESDFDKFKSLFPNCIGTELGQLKIEAESKCSWFIKKGCYLLKLTNGEYKIRWARKSKSEIIEFGVEEFYDRALR